MKIDQQNYEAYFLDYIEGRLDPFEIAELKSFLGFHPELKQALENFENLTLIPERIVFNQRAPLKKLAFHEVAVNDKNFEDFCIALNENQLSPEKSLELFSYLAINQHLKLHFDLYRKIYLVPEKITFDQKQNLYKNIISNQLTKFLVPWSSIAAGILVVVGIYFLFIDRTKSIQNSISSKAVIEYKIRPKSTLSLNPESSLAKEGISKPEFKVQHNSQFNYSNVIATLRNDTLNFVNKKEEIAYIPSIQFTRFENNMEFNSEINLNNYTYYIDNNDFKKQGLIRTFTKKIAYNINLLKNKKGKISIVKVAQLGLNGINQLTNANMQLIEKTDTAGNVLALSFESGLFEYHKIKSD